mgnify:CR=1 FL=1
MQTWFSRCQPRNMINSGDSFVISNPIPVAPPFNADSNAGTPMNIPGGCVVRFSVSHTFSVIHRVSCWQATKQKQKWGGKCKPVPLFQVKRLHAEARRFVPRCHFQSVSLVPVRCVWCCCHSWCFSPVVVTLRPMFVPGPRHSSIPFSKSVWSVKRVNCVLKCSYLCVLEH